MLPHEPQHAIAIEPSLNVALTLGPVAGNRADIGQVWIFPGKVRQLLAAHDIHVAARRMQQKHPAPRAWPPCVPVPWR